jgi:tetratricopeptide (TPR) repeat protein
MIQLLIFICLFALLSIFIKNYKKEINNKKLRTQTKKPKFEAISDLVRQGTVHRQKIQRKNLDFKLINETFDKADLFYAQNNFVEAEKIFIEVLTLNPEHLDANNKLGLIYIKTEKFAKAEAIFKNLITIEPRNAVYYSNLALCFYNQGFLIESKEAYERALELDPKKPNRLLSLGKVCEDLKYWKPAINAYSKALSLEPKNFELYFIIIDLLIRVKAFQEAEAFINTYLDYNPYDEKAKEKLRDIKILAGASPLTGNIQNQNLTDENQGENQLFE